MNDFVRWLLGLRKAPDWAEQGAWRIEFQSLPVGAAGLATLGLLSIAVALVWWLYRKEGRNLSWKSQLAMCGIRLAILGGVSLILLEMVLVITKHEQTPSQLAILIDTSESMGLNDPYGGDDEAHRIAAKIGLNDANGQPDIIELRKRSRLSLADSILDDLVERLRAGREVSVHAFADSLQPRLTVDARGALRASGAATAIGDAVNNYLAAERGQPIAGVVVITDGQSNAGQDLRQVAMQAGKEQIPIVGLAIGTDSGPSNARLIEIDANPVVFVKDPTELGVLIEARGLDGKTGVLTIDQRKDGGEWMELGREEVLLGADSTVRRVPFKFQADVPGNYEFRAKISDVGAELTEADNVAQQSMKVVRQRIRVLLIAGTASPEVQFIRNSLMRDQSVEFASWLQSASDGYEHIGHRPLRRLPNEQKELEYYDVLVLFDPDMPALGQQWSEMITKFVGGAGGGLIYVAGEMHSQRLFATAALNSSDSTEFNWLKTLPVVTDPSLYESSAEVRLGTREAWNLELTPEGANDAIFRFSPDSSRNKEILVSLPGMYWHFPVTRSKQGAAVLARHGDPRMQNQFGRHVLVATQLYGPGRTMFIGFDSTYRWRYLHEEYFDGFWARMVDRLGRSKVLGGRYPFTLSTDKLTYRTGDRVTVRIKTIHASDDTGIAPELRAELEIAGQSAQPLELSPLADQPGAFEATIAAEAPGAYTVRVVPGVIVDADSSLRPATHHFRVEPPRQEFDNPTLNRALLEDAAKSSRGRVFALADYQDLPNAISLKHVERVLEYRDELWDAPILFGGVILLLTIEWVMRKVYRMA